ncbi:hypothetical protein OMP38_28475 [Cohnella ginsengisoli]|uniref:Uncharacterized protein n=1 Tax=Cohnella ginsengisoli TaxID=425004 RepID=A0A9X4QQ85_9BACL|nr:hypothetical protein [Cohnella ginsengisoli]MDG0794332.1 hypothetical protein [Cohnella ginsengisoli]
MSGRNNRPENGGPAGHPGRLDQFGDKLGTRNDDEFRSAADKACSTGAKGKSRG